MPTTWYVLRRETSGRPRLTLPSVTLSTGFYRSGWSTVFQALVNDVLRDRRKIVEQYQKGVYQRKIAKSLKLSSFTVHNIIQRFRESGTISVRKGQGQKTILDARDLRALRRHCITYRNATVMEITTWAQEYFQKTLSVNTIHRAIRRCRLKLYRSKKKPYLNMIQKRRRFLWAKAHF